jgi:hypothetical protein
VLDLTRHLDKTGITVSSIRWERVKIFSTIGKDGGSVLGSFRIIFGAGCAHSRNGVLGSFGNFVGAGHEPLGFVSYFLPQVGRQNQTMSRGAEQHRTLRYFPAGLSRGIPSAYVIGTIGERIRETEVMGGIAAWLTPKSYGAQFAGLPERTRWAIANSGSVASIVRASPSSARARL